MAGRYRFAPVQRVLRRRSSGWSTSQSSHSSERTIFSLSFSRSFFSSSSEDEINYLNITSEIHFLTLKHSIQVLRLNNFDANSIQRRSNPLDNNDTAEIMHWSNHRVMEWLKSIDLSEYAPNLRGSGVCGALLVRHRRSSREKTFLFPLDPRTSIQCLDSGGDLVDSRL